MKFAFLDLSGKKAGVWASVIFFLLASYLLTLGVTEIAADVRDRVYGYFYAEEIALARQAEINARQQYEQAEKELSEKSQECYAGQWEEAIAARAGGSPEAVVAVWERYKKKCAHLKPLADRLILLKNSELGIEKKK